MTATPIIQEYATSQRRRGLRPRTVHRVNDVLRHLDTFYPGRLLELDAEDLHRWLESTPRADQTRYGYLSVVHNFFCWAITEGRTDRNPAAGIPRPKIRPGLPRPIRHDDLDHALMFAPPQVRAWLMLAAYAGLRCQEIAGLERCDILDHEDPVMIHVVHGKGGRERMVPAHPDVLAALRLAGLPRTGPLFRSPHSGLPYQPHHLSLVGNRYLHSVGIASTMHQLRHRFGTDFYRGCRDIRLTQDVMGHASLTTTGIYTQTNPLDAVAVVNALTIRGRATPVAEIATLHTSLGSTG